MKIFKYTLEVKDKQDIKILGLKRVLSILIQKDALVLYAAIEDSEVESILTVVIHGTGHEIPLERLTEWAFLGSVSQYNGQLIWHIFYKSRKSKD